VVIAICFYKKAKQWMSNPIIKYGMNSSSLKSDNNDRANLIYFMKKYCTVALFRARNFLEIFLKKFIFHKTCHMYLLNCTSD